MKTSWPVHVHECLGTVERKGNFIPEMKVYEGDH